MMRATYDKPHRCPKCWAVDWDGPVGYFRRMRVKFHVFTCPNGHGHYARWGWKRVR